MPTFPEALAAEARYDEARRRIIEAEAAALRFSLSGVDVPTFQARSEAEREAAARRFLEAYEAPDAVLKRELLAAWQAGSVEAGRLVAAADRGDQHWQTEARAMLALERAA